MAGRMRRKRPFPSLMMANLATILVTCIKTWYTFKLGVSCELYLSAIAITSSKSWNAPEIISKLKLTTY